MSWISILLFTLLLAHIYIIVAGALLSVVVSLTIITVALVVVKRKGKEDKTIREDKMYYGADEEYYEGTN